MEDHSSRAVRRVIAEMHQNLGKQFSVDEMARTALLSKYHFCRVFHRVTGVSPGRFLSAIRFQRAKHLLLACHGHHGTLAKHLLLACHGRHLHRHGLVVGAAVHERRQRIRS